VPRPPIAAEIHATRAGHRGHNLEALDVYATEGIVDSKTENFRHHRERLFGLAYRMLGSRADAEDVLQDAYLRWHETDTSAVRSSEAWLTTAVTRLAIDRSRRRRTEREAYSGPWLPEPLSDGDLHTPEAAAELDGDISIAFMTLLETLGPEERAAFVLHDVLDDDYADIAESLGKTVAACRQMVHRARERLTSRRRRFLVDDATRTRMLERFIAAANRGDREALVALFAPDAVMTSDGGGKAVAVFRPLYGAERISWLWFAVARRRRPQSPERRIVQVNGEPGVALYLNGHLHSVAAIETDGERISAYYSIANPDKLSAFL
jgi:RNA polymerase sigma-70 factor, ECF subfamily